MTPVLMTVLIVVGVMGTLLSIVLAAKMIHVAAPNQVLIVSGLQRAVGGESLGYRCVRGGRVVLLPLLETLDRLDLTNLVVEERVLVRSKGFVPLWVEVTAHARVAGERPALDKAAMRLLGKSREQVLQLARDVVLEATAGVVASVTPEMLVGDRASAEHAIREEVEHDFTRIGLELDELRLREVTDDAGYLAAIAR